MSDQVKALKSYTVLLRSSMQYKQLCLYYLPTIIFLQTADRYLNICHNFPLISSAASISMEGVGAELK